ncbi:MAG: hypothetical protein ACRDRM_10475 [Pseudonocardiaceae bacterium]
MIAVALIGGAATVIAAAITQSDGQKTTSPTVLSTVSVTPTQTTLPQSAEPEGTAPEATIPPVHTLSGDLGVSRPITRPACNGQFVVFVGAAVHPPTYQTEVQHLLDTYPGSEYLRANDTCPSLRARNDAGNEIYGVYFGPFTTHELACRAQDSWGGTSYVKVLDTVTDPDMITDC